MDAIKSYCNVVRHQTNQTLGPLDTLAFRMNKNPHAVALGRLTSPAKAKAAKANGAQGGRPAGS